MQGKPWATKHSLPRPLGLRGLLISPSVFPPRIPPCKSPAFRWSSDCLLRTCLVPAVCDVSWVLLRIGAGACLCIKVQLVFPLPWQLWSCFFFRVLHLLPGSVETPSAPGGLPLKPVFSISTRLSQRDVRSSYTWSTSTTSIFLALKVVQVKSFLLRRKEGRRKWLKILHL